MNWIKKSLQRFYHLPSKRTVVIFSILLGVILLAVSLKNSWPLPIAIPALSILVIAMSLIPKFGRAIFAVLSLITFPIGNSISFVILALVYFFIITPIGLLRNRQFKSGWNESSIIEKTKLYE